jgi:hypothetical protein
LAFFFIGGFSWFPRAAFYHIDFAIYTEFKIYFVVVIALRALLELTQRERARRDMKRFRPYVDNLVMLGAIGIHEGGG